MGLLIKKLLIEGQKGKVELDVLFDTGASYSFIKKEIAEKIGILVDLVEPKKFLLADGKKRLRITKLVNLQININGCKVTDEVLVAENLSDDMIIGATTMQKWRIKLDMENERVIIDPKVVQLKLV